MKRNLNCVEGSGLAGLLDMEAAHQAQTGRAEDHREAAKAFVEKRAHFRRPVNRQSISRAVAVLDK